MWMLLYVNTLPSPLPLCVCDCTVCPAVPRLTGDSAGCCQVKLAIFRTSNGCGWGVKALEPIKRGSFVAEYVGEVITNEEAERRGEKYGQYFSQAVGGTATMACTRAAVLLSSGSRATRRCRFRV